MRLGTDAAERKRHHDRHLRRHPVLTADVVALEPEPVVNAGVDAPPGVTLRLRALEGTRAHRAGLRSSARHLAPPGVQEFVRPVAA